MEKKKPGFWLGFVVGIVAFTALGLCFYAGTLVAGKDDKKDTKTEEKQDGKKDEENVVLQLDDKQVKEANRFIPKVLCHGYELNLDHKSRKITELSDKEKLALLVAYFTEELYDGDHYTDDGSKLTKKKYLDFLKT